MAGIGIKNYFKKILREDYIVRSSDDLEIKVIAAVKEFACSINFGEKVVADMTSLIDVTSQLYC